MNLRPLLLPFLLYRQIPRSSSSLYSSIMGKAPKSGGVRKFYAVRRGRRTGIFDSWDQVARSVNGYSGAEHKSFKSKEEAEHWLNEGKRRSGSGLGTAEAHEDEMRRRHGSPSSSSDDDSSSPSQPPSTSSPLVIHIDGSALSNGTASSRAGIGVWFSHNHPDNLAEPLPPHLGPHTNNRAELYAAYRALEVVIPREDGKRVVVLRTDSEYTIKIFTEWLPGWKAKNWKRSDGRPVENADMIKLVEGIIEEFKKGGGQVEWEWVRGHADDVGNEGADRLAKQGASGVGVGVLS